MAASQNSWWFRHRSLVPRVGFGLCLLVIACESLLLYLQASANRAAETQSARLLNTFLQRDTLVTPRAPGVAIRLHNVRFHWSDRVYIDTPDMAVRAVPVEGSMVDFDHLDSFLLTVQQSEVRIRPDVLEGMLNESVFNYPGSKLRDLKVTLTTSDGRRFVHLTGKARVLLWVPFKMEARLGVDQATNTLVIESAHMSVLGGLPVTALIKLEPLQLEHLISLPPNNSLRVVANRIMLKPFSLFPPPRINGRMSGVTIEQDVIRLKFAGAPIPAPASTARNYVYLKGGASQFGSLCMTATDILIVDQAPGNAFAFSLKDYARLLPRSTIATGDLKSIQVTMPDDRVAARAP